MRTKTILLSALLGTVGSVSLMAQSTNVYSLNAVGYINIAVQPGFNMVSCPLIASPDNTINTLLTNNTGTYKKWQFYAFNATTGTYTEDIGTASGWANNGVETLDPGQAAWLYNPSNSVTTVTFVGTVPQGTLTNTILPGFNLISTIVPTSGDIVTNSIMNYTNAVKKDQVYTWSPATQTYTEYIAGAGGSWPAGDPVQPIVGGGFFYYSAAAGTNNYWVENFSVSQ